MNQADASGDFRLLDLVDPGPQALDLDSRRLEELLLAASLTPAVADLLARFRRSCSEWMATVNVLDELIFMVDDQGLILRANNVLEQWGLGSVESAVNRPLHEWLHPGCDNKHCYLLRGWRSVSESTEAGMKLRGIEVEDPVLERVLEVGWHRIPDLEEEAGGRFVVVVLRDITDLDRERKRLFQRNQDEVLDYMARGLAHEIGNPLAGVKTSLQVLASHYETFDEKKKQVYLKRILDGTERIWSIVHRVLNRGASLGRLQKVEAHAAFERLWGIFIDPARAAGVTLKLDDEPGLMLHASSAAVDEVLANLLTNALEACGEGDQVSVTAQSHENEVVVTVQDTGCGISPGDLGRIFQPFFTTKSSGTGIGMARAAFLMRSMGGLIAVDSREGVGTKVFLTFRSGSGA